MLVNISRERYLEILHRVVFDGHWPVVASAQSEMSTIRIHGAPLGDDGLRPRDSDGRPVQGDKEEAEEFRSLVGDLQHELARPPALTDHLKTLNTLTTNLELKRFYARTRHGIYPRPSSPFRIPIRLVDGNLHHFHFQPSCTDEFGDARDPDYDLDQVAKIERQGSGLTLVPSKVVTCLRPLDTSVPPTFVIGLAEVCNPTGERTGFILVWFLDKQSLGLVYDYTKHSFPGEENMSDEDFNIAYAARTPTLKGTLPGSDLQFSMAMLDGDYRFGDGKDPQGEAEAQVDIHFTLRPFVFQGFSVEDACRVGDTMQPLSLVIERDLAEV